jgi:predicted transcriptional regulator
MRTISTRLDDATEAAFDRIVAAYNRDQSTTLRDLINAEDQRLRNVALMREADSVRNNPDDQAEAFEILEEMEFLRAW